MQHRRHLLALGLTVSAVTAFSAGSASAAPIEGEYEPSGPFHATLEVYPHNPEAAQLIFSNAATHDPEAGEAFVNWLTGGSPSLSNACPTMDIADCDLDKLLNEPI